MPTRNLQITIFEAPRGGRRSPRRGRSGDSRFDPGDYDVMPPPEDPGDYDVMPPPEDPGDYDVMPPPEDPGDYDVMPPPEDPGDYDVMPPPEDPRGGLPGVVPVSGAAGAYVSARYVAAGGGVPGQVPVCCCPCDETRPRTPEKPGVSPRDYSGFLIVRVAQGVEPLTVDSLWELAEAARLDGLRSVLELPLEEGGEERVAETAEPEVLRSIAELTLGRELPERDKKKREGRQGDEEDSLFAAAGSAAGGRHGLVRGLFRRIWRQAWREREEEERPPEPAGALVSRPLIQLRGRNRKSTVWALQKEEELASRTSFRPRHSLARYWRVDLRPFPELVEEVLAAFNGLAEVDLAYRELRALDTAFHEATVSGDALAGDQGYLDPAPVGIGAARVRRLIEERLQEKPAKLRIIDLEQGWHHAHAELGDLAPPDEPLLVHGENREEDEPGSGNHGAAVLGQLAAAGTGPLRLRGSAAGFAEFQLASHYRRRLRPNEEPSLENPFPGTNGHVASAIVNCLIAPDGEASPLGRGDLLLLEIQRGRLPTEIDEADFDAIRLATARGIVVVEAAGNG
ncbi:MAG TPA: hypothetical protein VLF66_20410, partial [Thermoanaerobaculia bacterium]|nr:hypothetical protein [Thermoanaerobaculia bacterium]